MVTIGAAEMVRAWGRSCSLTRGATVLLASVKMRFSEVRPSSDQLDYSVSQHNFNIIMAAEDAGAVRPQKFDIVTRLDTGEQFTVQRGHTAGADVDELLKMWVTGGQT